MGRNSNIQQLSVEDNLAVDACIRKRRFITVDAILEELVESGINISRAGLHRYMQKLKKRDSLNFGSPNDTVIVVMQRSTGAVFNLTTTASVEVVVAMIEAMPRSV